MMQVFLKILILSLLISQAFTQVLDYGIDNTGLVSGKDPFYDPNFDYSEFPGRITDRNDAKTVFKVSTENRNTRFFKPGDRLFFTVRGQMRRDQSTCEAYIRATEKGFFVMFVQNLFDCLKTNTILRRGTQVNFKSKTLALRVYEASVYRKSLLKKRIDFMKQLNNINNYIWSFDEQKAIQAAEYDKKILQLQKEKEQALDQMILTKKDKIRLQKRLIDSLKDLDIDLKHYRPTRHELLVDRWNMDYDVGVPVDRRPQRLKRRDLDASQKTSRWDTNKKFK